MKRDGEIVEEGLVREVPGEGEVEEVKKGFLQRFELDSEVMVGSLVVKWSMLNEDLS